MSLLYDSPRSATVQCDKPGKLWAVDRVTFQTIVVSSHAQAHLRLIDFLKMQLTIPQLHAAPPDQLGLLASQLVPISFGKGETIYQKGDVSSSFYILQVGSVSVQVPGVEDSIKTLTAGAYFGEAALTTAAPRSCTVTVVSERAVCLALDRDSFSQLTGSPKLLLQKVMILMNDRDVCK